MSDGPRSIVVDGDPAPHHEVANFLRRHIVALVTQDEAGKGRSILITRLPFLVGRSQSATMAIAHETISRRHAQIRLCATGQLELVDVGSSNGSFVNGERVSSALLEDGDQIRFGTVRYELVIEDRGPMTILRD